MNNPTNTGDKNKNYQKLFGELDFRKGNSARSVYSPAAYMTDLAQLKDDEIDSSDFDKRRPDVIKNVVLNEDNTFDEIPYLDIVNEQLEAKVAALSSDTTKEEIASEAYDKLLKAKYPVNLPFDLNNEKIKLYLNYLNISPEAFYKKLAPSNTNQYDYDRIASDYLGVSGQELATLSDDLSDIFEENGNDPKNKILIESGVNGKKHIKLENILAGLKISYDQLSEILTQNLSDIEVQNNLQAVFYINQDAKGESISLVTGVDGKSDVESIVRAVFSVGSTSPESTSDIEIDDLVRIYRLVYLANKTKMSFSDLDLVVRTCCGNKLDDQSAVVRALAIVKYFKEKFDITVEEVCSLVSSINTLGFGEDDDDPSDLFNKTFNGDFAHIDKKYINHSANNAIVPEQYSVIENRGYIALATFEGDILNDTPNNTDFKDRLYRTLGLSSTQFNEIIRAYRSKENEKFDNSGDYDRLWVYGGANNGDHSNLLNTLYRTKKLMEAFGLTHSELFTLLDVIEHDALLRGVVHRDIFIDLDFDDKFNLQDYSPYDILRGATNGHENPAYRLWLFQVMDSLVDWLNDNELTTTDLLMIATGETPRNLNAESGEEEERLKEESEKTSDLEKLAQLNQLYSRIKPTLFTDFSFVGGLFNNRFSRIIYESITHHKPSLVSHQDSRLVRFDKEQAKLAARNAIGQLDFITHDDFLGLGIEDVVAQKIFQNLVLMGYLSTDGMMDMAMLPTDKKDFALETDFTPIRDQLFEKIMDVHENYVDAAIFPSDLEFLGLTTRETEELYDNLKFNNYLDLDGTIKQQATFESNDNKSLFEVNSRIGVYAEDVYEHIHDRLAAFEKHTIAVSPEHFEELNLSEVELNDIYENLIWNEYLSKEGFVQNKKKILALTKETFLLTVKFYPYQQQILDILQNTVKKVHADYAKFDQDHFFDIAEKLVADWTYSIIEDHFLEDAKLTNDSKRYFSDSDNLVDFDVTWPFTEEHNRIVFQHIKDLLEIQNKYIFSIEALENLSFSEAEQHELVTSLINSGYLTNDLHLDWNSSEYFLNSENAVLFSIKAFEDYNKDIFFMLHELAKRLNAAELAIVESLEAVQKLQKSQLYSALKEIMGLKEASSESLTHWIFSSAENAEEQWILPVLSSVDNSDEIVNLPNDIRFNKGYERFKRFAMLSSKLKMDEHEINLIFHDQDLVDKFSENISLPTEIIKEAVHPIKVKSFNALLESSDGYIYLFKNSSQGIEYIKGYQLNDDGGSKTPEYAQTNLMARYWVYNSKTGKQVDLESNHLSTFLTGDVNSNVAFDQVQAAFVDSLGRDVLVVDGAYYYREPAEKMDEISAMMADISDDYGSNEKEILAAKYGMGNDTYQQIPCMNSNPWQVMEREWGNTHDEGEAFHQVDAAFNDATGGTYLISGDRIARYSNIIDKKIDSTYPKNYDETDLDESLFGELPEEFRGHIDAAVANGKGGTYFFKGSHYINSQEPNTMHSIAKHWGKEEIELSTLEKSEAAFAFNGKWYLFSGEHVFGYRDCIENDGLEILEGFPKKITEFLGVSLPSDFHRDIDAAFVISDYSNHENSRLYLFHEDKFIVGSSNQTGSTWEFGVEQDVSLWGNVQNLLASDGVNATLSGLDGRTYIFCGSHYYRYSGKDYYETDAGYPRSISEDWAGLQTINAAFTWNNATYLFGQAEGENKYVRYSTNDYTEVDNEYPKLQKENKEHLWNLPVTMAVDTLTGVDAVFNSPDNKTYLFLGKDFVYYDETNNWWSEPKPIAEHWDSISEVESVEAAFTGKNKKTYFFVQTTEGLKFYRFSDADYCKPDVGYPRPVGSFWGNIKNHIIDCDRIDAAVSLTSREVQKKQDNDDFFEAVKTNHVYIFSRDQYYRYRADKIGRELTNTHIEIEPGYPKSITQLKFEPRFKELKHSTSFMSEIADGLDAVMSDERNVYLFKGTKIQVLSDHCDANTHEFKPTIKALIQEEGALFAIESNQWRHISSLEGTGGVVVGKEPEVPTWLSNLPDDSIYANSSNISAVLNGTDHNTYIFSGSKFLNKQLNREYDISDYWGKVRNNIYDNNHVDAAFTGVDNKLYLFSGDQYYVYEWNSSTSEYGLHIEEGNIDDTGVHSVAEDWNGLTNVNIAYRLGDKTYLCEKPDSTGQFRYLCYKGSDYTKPMFAKPKYSSVDMWGMPNHLLSEGWSEFDTILVENSDTVSEQTLLFVKDSEFVQYNVAGNHWFEPKPIDKLWAKLPCHHEVLNELEAMFIDPAGSVHLFGDQCVIKYGIESGNTVASLYGEEQIHNVWGKLKSKVDFSKGIDATYISESGQTYLFSGEHYVRYSHANYCHIDDGYPKLVAEHLRNEPGFEDLPKDFEVKAKAHLSASGKVMGVVSNDRNRYVVIGNLCYVSSGQAHTHLSLNKVIYRRNNLMMNYSVDAALYIDADPGITPAPNTLPATYLFSGDQYFRYTGKGCMTLDAGYPKRISNSLAADLSKDTGATITLNPWFSQGIDAAVYTVKTETDAETGLKSEIKTLHIFKSSKYQELIKGSLSDISEQWGKRDNTFRSLDNRIDAAFVDDDGGLIVIKDSQVVRYSDTEQEYIEPGYPKAITDLFHQLPKNYYLGKKEDKDTDGITGAFTYSGRLYLLKENDDKLSSKASYVRYPANINKHGHFGCLGSPGDLSPYYPTTFEQHWSDTGDIRLYDLQRIFRYKELQRTYSGEHTLLDVIRKSGGYAKEPYRMLADMFGWHIDDIKWLKRNNKLMPTFNDDERHFKLEEIERLFDILQLREKLDARVEDLFDCWDYLYLSSGEVDDDSNIADAIKAESNGALPTDNKTLSRVMRTLAAEQLLKWLETRHAGSNEGEILDDEIHNKLNLLKRDALLEYVIHYTESNRGEDYDDARDVYEDLLIDVKMGETAETSRVKEAISALQLYFHRYFINLEEGKLKNTKDPEAERDTLKARWEWMKNYRVWEANRKVFLYPENYIRPELRDSKTPEFKALEQNLLQGELNEDNIEQAYQSYIDSYSEISRLTIAGGYVYPDPDAPETNNKSVVLLGRTKTQPNTYYYRFANFMAKKEIPTKAVDPADAISVENIDWKPWEKIDIQIDSDRVYPVYALNKIFLFWAKIESRTTNIGSSKVSFKTDETTKTTTADSTEHNESVLKIYYSFYNLNGQWSSPQKLNYEITSNDTITNYFLEFTGNNSEDEVKMDSIQVKCHFSSERELTPEEDANGKISAKQLTDLTKDGQAVYIKSITESDEYFLKTDEDNNPADHVFASRIIPGDELPNTAGFKLVNSLVGDKNYISFQSLNNSSNHLRHQGGIGKVTPDTGVPYKADSSFSVSKGLVGSGYTIFSTTPNYTRHVLYYGENKALQIKHWDELETFSEQRNASFKFVTNRQSKQNSFQFFPDSNVVTEVNDGSFKIKRSVYQSGFDTFNKVFPSEDSSYVSLPVLLNVNSANGGGEKPWVCFDYKGGSFLCKPSVDQNLAIGKNGIKSFNTNIDTIDAAFYVNKVTYVFGDGKIAAIPEATIDGEFHQFDNKAPNNGVVLDSKWWKDDRTDDSRKVVEIDAALSVGDDIYLFRSDKYVKFNKSNFDTAKYTTAFDLATSPEVILPKALTKVDAAFSWDGEQYFISGDAHVTTSDLINPKTNQDLFIDEITDDYLKNNVDKVVSVFKVGSQDYVSIELGTNKHELLPIDQSQLAVISQQLTGYTDVTTADSDKSIYHTQVHSNKAKRAFVLGEYLYYELTTNEKYKIELSSLESHFGFHNDKNIISAYVNPHHVGAVANNEIVLISNYSTEEYMDQEVGNKVLWTSNIKGFNGSIKVFVHSQNVYFTDGNIIKGKPINTIDEPSNNTEIDLSNSSLTLDVASISGISSASPIRSAYVLSNELVVSTTDIDYKYTKDSNSNKFKLVGRQARESSLSEITAACSVGTITYLFSGDSYYKVINGQFSAAVDISDRWEATEEPNNLEKTQKVDAAFKRGSHLYLTSGDQYYKYELSNLPSSGGDGRLMWGYPKKLLGNSENLPENSDLVAAFHLPKYEEGAGTDKVTHEPQDYFIYSKGQYKKQKNSTGGFEDGSIYSDMALPEAVKGLNAALNIGEKLYLIVGKQYVEYDKAQLALAAHKDQKYDIVRLSSMTGSQLNKRLFVGGIDHLMKRDVQEINELPKFILDYRDDSIKSSAGNTSQGDAVIMVDPKAINGDLFPVDSHLEYRGANGQYYWELFYHAPSLIANSLNTSQKFEEAKRWYEYIFDPTNKQDYWKFLPFLAVDVDAIVEELQSFSEILNKKDSASFAQSIEKIEALSNKLAPFGPALRGETSLPKKDDSSHVDLITLNELHKWEVVDLNNDGEDDSFRFSTWPEVSDVLTALETDYSSRIADETTQALESTLELIGVIKRLPIRYNIMVASGQEQIQAYLDDPFDPHAIANLRRIAYRRTTVMAYIDNLLDWGDALFRQYTHETINEARMLYVLAYDLLGKKPEYMGEIQLSEDTNYSAIRNLGADTKSGEANKYDFLFDSSNADSNTEASFTHAGIVHESVGNPYFYVPENTELLKYWERIEDRLHKIRNSLNIMGVKQPLPLFQPPIDPMALVNAAASGAGISAAIAGMNISVPHYRFNFMLNKARELTGKVTQFGNDLLGNIEKKEAEALSMLQNKQESAIQDISRDIKVAQLREAKENLKNLEESKVSAQDQLKHHQRLKKQGKIPEEVEQINLMKDSLKYQINKPILEAAAAVASALPNISFGPPFASKGEIGGSIVGASLGYAASIMETLSGISSTKGEIAGLEAQFDRMAEDWDLQILMSESEIKQLDFQIEGAKWAIKSAEQELVVHDKEVEHTKSMSRFMKDKFSNEQLYQWMTSKLSKLFFQTYQMAYDLAKGAEKAYVYENGLPMSEVNFIGGTYWDSLHKGLMSGDELAYDLDRLEKYAIDNNSRGFEITKTISLPELDPIAFLKLKDKKECEFTFTEELFDYDFPGHYNRQIKTIAIKFVAGEGKVVNATLTQLSNKTVMKPDVKAVKYLMNPKDEQPLSIRSDWRPTQQIAASQPDPYSENSSGLFEVNFGDDRYLPFEGTGAVSRWRLELGGKKGSYELGEITDVQIEIQYTAMQGGKAFSDAVKGMLKPYETAVHIDFATTFPNEFFAWVHGETEDMEIVMTQDRFPNISGSKLTAVYPLFEVKDEGQVSMTINDDSSLTLRSGKLLMTNALTVSKRGDVWKFSAKGNKADLVNAALVFSYKASVV